jgi:16S rRNA (cytosine967-C5)-methyltransferase
MSRYHSYIHSSKTILLAYTGKEPFAAYLKKHFGANKKFGSKDRRQISHLCYCWFRLGKAIASAPMEEQLLMAVFLCSTESNDVLANLKPEWNEQVKLGTKEKLSLINHSFDLTQLFPFAEELSDGIDAEEFALSHFIQPDLFLRIRPGEKEKVLNKLNTAGFSFHVIDESCLALPNATKMEEVIVLNKEAVVQDYSSQRVGEFLGPARDSSSNPSTPLRVWDCCAASGGKSIMVYDLLPGMELTVSDIRNSILMNLQSRFAEAGIKKYNSFVADLSDSSFVSHHSSYDLLIADVPCSGSGTWGRTPEQLHFFAATKIDEYAALQKKIVRNVAPYIKKNGLLLYITCSVFKKENEEVVSFIQEQVQMELIELHVLKGYDKKADSMFAALLRKK